MLAHLVHLIRFTGHINAKGLVIGVTNVAISTSLSLDDGSGNGSVNLLNDGLSVLGSDYIETQVVGSNPLL